MLKTTFTFLIRIFICPYDCYENSFHCISWESSSIKRIRDKNWGYTTNFSSQVETVYVESGMDAINYPSKYSNYFQSMSSLCSSIMSSTFCYSGTVLTVIGLQFVYRGLYHENIDECFRKIFESGILQLLNRLSYNSRNRHLGVLIVIHSRIFH